MSTLLYFAYGSNMSTARLAARVNSARVLSTATLDSHRLVFRKRSHDGSAKCDIARTGEVTDIVHGVVYRLDAADKRVLDRYEGLGRGYDDKNVTITAADGAALDAITYYAIDIDDSLAPYSWYREHVLRGAREHRLPAAHIDAIASTPAIDDPDAGRHRAEMAIYGRDP